MTLEQTLRAQGGALARAVVPGGEQRSGVAELAASGPRTRAQAHEYELLMEMIVEGSRLHYGTPRIVKTSDRDLALLLGDQLYALGLARLAALGDLDAVAELADVISLVAQAHAGGNPDLAEAIWEAGAIAIGWGGSERHERAKDLVRAADPAAADALRAAAAVHRAAVS